MLSRRIFPLLFLLGMLLASFVPSGGTDVPLGLDQVGVVVGNEFNLNVKSNTLDLTVLGIDDLDVIGVDLGKIGINVLKFVITQGETSVTPKGNDIIKVKVTKLPSPGSAGTAAVLGAISLSLKGVTQEITTGFIIGTPVTFTEWQIWNETLHLLRGAVNQLTDFHMTLVINENDTHFTSDIILQIAVPQEAQQYIKSLVIQQVMSYEKTKGIQEMMTIKVTATSISAAIGSYSQLLHLERTTEQPTTASTDQETTSLTGFDGLVTVLGIAVIIPVVRKISRNGR